MITRRSTVAGAASLLAAPMLSPRIAGAAEKWRHAILASKGDAAFFFMAKHKGFWAKRGLDVDIIELKGETFARFTGLKPVGCSRCLVLSCRRDFSR